jgi:site-specific DNA-cytosine methylase
LYEAVISEDDVTPPLVARGPHAVGQNVIPTENISLTLSGGNDQIPFTDAPLLLDGRRVDDVRVYTEPVQTLQERMGTGGNNVPVVAQEQEWKAYDEYNDTLNEIHHSLRAGTKQSTGVLGYPTLIVRRLTPLECERLMGWPDGHTSESTNGTVSDTQRYKMCGNGVASPVAQWIGEHIARASGRG